MSGGCGDATAKGPHCQLCSPHAIARKGMPFPPSVLSFLDWLPMLVPITGKIFLFSFLPLTVVVLLPLVGVKQNCLWPEWVRKVVQNPLFLWIPTFHVRNWKGWKSEASFYFWKSLLHSWMHAGPLNCCSSYHCIYPTYRMLWGAPAPLLDQPYSFSLNQ